MRNAGDLTQRADHMRERFRDVIEKWPPVCDLCLGMMVEISGLIVGDAQEEIAREKAELQ